MNENNELNNNVTPVEPVQPTEPAQPVVEEAPVVESAPVEPVAPVEAAPVEPVQPAVESAPVEPAKPEPIQPVDAAPTVTEPAPTTQPVEQTTTTQGEGTTTTEGSQENDKLYGVLSYLGFLSLIVLYVIKPKSDYALFHAKQGSNLFIIQLIINIFDSLVIYILRLAHIPFAGTLVSLVSTAVWILSLVGLIWAIQGVKKELPVINKIKIIK